MIQNRSRFTPKKEYQDEFEEFLVQQEDYDSVEEEVRLPAVSDNGKMHRLANQNKRQTNNGTVAGVLEVTQAQNTGSGIANISGLTSTVSNPAGTLTLSRPTSNFASLLGASNLGGLSGTSSLAGLGGGPNLASLLGTSAGLSSLQSPNLSVLQGISYKPPPIIQFKPYFMERPTWLVLYRSSPSLNNVGV